MIELSIALISYNSEDYIKEALNSILKQKCSFNFEVVIGDDCSTDKTYNIIKSYQIKHPQIFKIKQNKKQLGILKNFKLTLERCTGKYIFNFDGDDIIKSELAFKKILDVFKNNPNLGFVDAGYDMYFEAYNKTKKYVNKQSIRISKEEYRNFVYLGKIIPIGTCFNREKLFKHVDFNTHIKNNITIEDYPTLVDVVANCDFGRVDESLFTYRIHRRSYSFNNEFKKNFFQRQQMLSLFNHFKTKYNFNNNLSYSYEQSHYKSMLHLAGSYNKGNLGIDMFKKIESKNIYDFINYLASQYKFVRNLAKIRKFKNTVWYKTQSLFLKQENSF